MTRPDPSFGVELHGYLDAGTLLSEIVLAERLGYDAVWLGDSQLIWREMFVLLGAAAAATDRVALGSGVTNPTTRHLTVMASGLVTLHELSGGRVQAGIGAGDSAVKMLGERPASRARLAAFVADVRSLSEGRTVTTPAAELRLTFGGKGKCPPILIAAAGPRMLRLAGEIGDGVIVPRRGDALPAMLGCVTDGRRSSGRSDAAFRTCLSTSVAIHPDRVPALQAVRPHVASTLRAHVHWELSEAAREAQERITAAYDMYQHMDPAAVHAVLVPDDVVEQFAIAGSADDCIRHVVELFETGVDEITIRPYSVLDASRAVTIERFANEVMGPVREGRLDASMVTN